MRLLFVTRKFPPSTGGMEVFSKQLYDALRRLDPQTQAFVPASPIIGRPSLIQLLKFYLGAAIQIVRDRRRIDVLLLGDTLLLPLALVARLFCRHEVTVVGTAHGNDVFFAEGTASNSKVYRFVIARFANMVNLLVANSQYTAQAASTLGFENVAVVPLATTIQNVSRFDAPRPVILFAGRLIRYKGLSWFIREVLPLVNVRLSLQVAGPPWDETEMNAVKQCVRVKYLGVLDPVELAALRASVTVCIMPNLPADATTQGEGFGLSALEAPAVGVPIIVTSCGGLQEAVVEDVTGFLVEPLAAKAFAAKINEIYSWTEERRRKYSDNARKMISERFTWERVGRDYLNLIMSIHQDTLDSQR